MSETLKHTYHLKENIFTTNVIVKKIVLATSVDPARIAHLGNAVTATTSVVRIASQVWPVESSLL